MLTNIDTIDHTENSFFFHELTKIRWFVTGQLFAVSILVAGVTSVIGLPFKEVPQLQRFANFVVLPLGLVAGVGHSIWVNKRFKVPLILNDDAGYDDDNDDDVNTI